MKHHFPRPRILVSRCLGFSACRYDGQQLRSGVIDLLREHVDFVDICPEMEAGLGVPRAPIRLCQEDGRIEVWQQASARTVTADLREAAQRLLQDVDSYDGAILKGRSPSCGLHDVKIYQGIEQPQFLRWDSGIFGSLVAAHLGHKAVEDEQRLTNFILREHFLIKLYVWARFRALAAQPRMGDLVAFHAAHKLLFLACNQSRFRVCGTIIANHERYPAGEVCRRYEQELRHILSRPFRRRSMVNTLHHAYGWIAEKLSAGEKEYIVNCIEEYRDERIPLQAVTRLIELQAIRFNHEYLLGQVLLRPYPSQLADLSDSGRGREI